MANEQEIHVRIAADAARYANGLLGATNDTKRFGAAARSEFERIKSSAATLRHTLAMLGGSYAALALAVRSAKLDKSLTQIGQTANGSAKDVDNLRQELWRMGMETGQKVEDLRDGFNAAVQAGLNFKQALPVTDAVNQAMAITGANAERLTGALTVAQAAFHFDLSKPGEAVSLLEKMTVAGRLGNAELENQSDIFARIGVNAGSAGMGFNQTLGFIQALSQVERQPERLATLADSTLQLFNTRNYMEAAAKATHVKFFNDDKSRRNPVDILKDIKKEYDKLGSEKDQVNFMQKAFGKADRDTIKGLRSLFSGDMLDNVDKFSKQIQQSGGTFSRDITGALDNAVDQTGRLKNALGKAADDFAKPINNAIATGLKFAMDKKEDGGLGLDGKDMLIGGAAITGATLLGGDLIKRLRARGGKGGMPGGNILKDVTGLGANVAIGKTLQTAAGVTPVFVVNMPSGADANAGLTGLPKLGTDVLTGPGGPAAMGKLGTVMMYAEAVTMSGAAGYGIGTWIHNNVESAIMQRFTHGRVSSVGEGIYEIGHNAEQRKFRTKLSIKDINEARAARGQSTFKSMADFEAEQNKSRAERGLPQTQSIFTTAAKTLGDFNAKYGQAIQQKIAETTLSGTITIKVDTPPGINAKATFAPSMGSTLKANLGAITPGGH